MRDAVSTPPRFSSNKAARLAGLESWLRSRVPTFAECFVALFAASALILSFPNFNLSFLAWVGFVPFLVLVARRPAPWQAFFLGWLLGSVFFYGTCYWLTYSMINFGGFAAWQAFAMLIPGALVLGIFPALVAMVLARSIKKWGTAALLLVPIVWAAMEWARLGITGQLWNAIGYSQAYHPLLIQPARLGGVYAVGFLIVAVNAAIAFALMRRTYKAIAISGTSRLPGLWLNLPDGQPVAFPARLQPTRGCSRNRDPTECADGPH